MLPQGLRGQLHRPETTPSHPVDQSLPALLGPGSAFFLALPDRFELISVTVPTADNSLYRWIAIALGSLIAATLPLNRHS